MDLKDLRTKQERIQSDIETSSNKLSKIDACINNINKIFEDRKFAQVILPTGAGKSFVALTQMQKYAIVLEIIFCLVKL